MAHIKNNAAPGEVERGRPNSFGDFVAMPEPPVGALDELRAAADEILSQTEMIPAPLLGHVRPVLADIDDKIGQAIAERATMWADREQYRESLHRAVHTIQTGARALEAEQERTAALADRIDGLTGSM
jgi:hypothetical protein